jgi:hypothetical protein
MSIEITEGTIGIWYTELPNNEGNWMAGAKRDPDGTYDVTYRFRYYRDEKTFESSDERRWEGFKIDSKKSDAVTRITSSLRFVQQHLGGNSYEVLRGTGSIKQFMEEFEKLPFVHVRRMSKKECESCLS